MTAWFSLRHRLWVYRAEVNNPYFPLVYLRPANLAHTSGPYDCDRIMGDAGKEDYKMQSFDADTQQLLKTALKGKCSVMSIALLIYYKANVSGLARHTNVLCLACFIQGSKFKGILKSSLFDKLQLFWEKNFSGVPKQWIP